MSMTIGRCAITRSPSVGSLRQSGDVVSFRAWLMAADVDEMNARIQQLRGLMNNPDEDTFPFTSAEFPALDGFYTDFSVEVEDSPGMLTSGKVPFSVRMRRVAGGYGRPRFETTVSRVVRTNSHGVTAPAGIPVAIANNNGTGMEQDWQNAFGLPTASGFGQFSVDGMDADLQVYEFAWSATSKSYRTTRTPAQFYQGAATVEVSYGGTFYPANGSQVQSDLSAMWRLSNGLTRVYPLYSSGRGSPVLMVENWDGAAWAGTEFAFIDGAVSATAYRELLGGGGAVQTTYAHARVIRNSPEACVIRMDYGYYSTTIAIAYGQPFVVVSIIQNEVGSTVKHGWRATAPGAPASATFTGGIKATAPDSNSRQFLLVNPAATSASTPSMWLTTAATASTWQMCSDFATYEISAFDGTAMRDYFIGHTAIRQQVVAR